MSQLALIDYGSGNLRSAENALRRAADELEVPPEILVTSDPRRVAGADRIVLPGVGAFASCMAALRSKDGLLEALDEAVRIRARPFLGVCVGMQLLADVGLEFGRTPGLGWIAGEVRRLEPATAEAKVPHVGWSDLAVERPNPLLAEGAGPFYFTHSFAFVPARPEDILASTDHGGRFAAAVSRRNVAGVQFHPEKSQAEGLAFIRRFLEWRP